MRMFRICLAIIFLGIISNSFGQDSLVLTLEKKNKKIVYQIGDNIGYSKKGIYFVRSGKLESITDSSIVVKGKSINLKDLTFFGHRIKGTNVIGISAAASAGFALGYLYAPEDNTKSEKITGLAVGIPLFVFAEYILWKNRLHEIRDGNRIDVSH